MTTTDKATARPDARLSQRPRHHRPAARTTGPALAAVRPLRGCDPGPVPDLRIFSPALPRSPASSPWGPTAPRPSAPRAGSPFRGRGRRNRPTIRRSQDWNTSCAACREWFGNSADANALRSSSATTATSTTRCARSWRFTPTTFARKGERRRMTRETGRLSPWLRNLWSWYRTWCGSEWTKRK